jgi:O-antigen/teichoic acid export membrane protein
MIYIAYFQAIKEIKLFSRLTVYNKLLSIVAMLFATFYWGINGYYISYNLSFIVMIIIALIIIKKTVKLSFSFNFRKIFSDHWKYAKSSLLSNIISETSAFLDIIIIGFFISDMQEIGYYSFALTMTIALRIFPSTVQQITIPYFSSFKLRKNEFMQIFKRYNRILYFVVFITLIIFLIFIPPLIHWLFNSKYDPSINYLILLSIGWSIRNLNQLQSGAIFGLGMNHYNAITAFTTLIGNIIIYPLALHHWGIIGVAYGSISSGLIIWFTSRYLFNKMIKKTIWET